MYPPIEHGTGSIQSIDQEAHFYGTDESKIIIESFQVYWTGTFQVYRILNQSVKIPNRILTKQKMDRL